MSNESGSSQTQLRARASSVTGYLIEQVKTQPHKSALMLALIGALVLLAVCLDRKPRQAGAQDLNLLPATQTEAPTQQATCVAPAPADNAAPAKPPEKLDPPPRNIFAIDLRFYPGSYSKGSKAGGDAELDPRQAELHSLRQQAQALELKSTMTASVPTAYIDDSLVHEGDTYKGFTVRKISTAEVIIEAKGHQFRLYLSQP